MPYCRKCGNKLDDDARFCRVCGTPVTPIPAVTPRTLAPSTRIRKPFPLAAINVSATGKKGIFGSDQPLALAFKENTSGSTLTYSVNVSRAEGWPVYNTLDVGCDVYLDPSINLDITIRTETGSITMNAFNGNVTLQKLNLQTTTGSVQASLEKGVVIAGDISLQTTTGSAQLIWDEVEISRSINVNVMTTTGSTEANIDKRRPPAAGVPLTAPTPT